MAGINSILDIGKLALFGSQAAIQTTGNNIANVNTEGYSRREVRFDENLSLDYAFGQIGTGARAAEIVRHFDTFIEAEYNDKASVRERYLNLWQSLSSVDSLFNEANTDGINAALNQFFQDFQDLSVRPEDSATREALLARTANMITLLRNTDQDLQQLQEQAEDVIRQDIAEVNDLLEQIADINKQLNAHDIPGQNNANQLYDERALAVRKLAEKLDITVIENKDPEYRSGIGSIGGDYSILTKAGHTLLQGTEVWELSYEGPSTSAHLTQTSNFDGQINFDGSDDFEYTIEVVQGGQVSNANAGTAQFRVSLDGGMTWVKNEDGTERHFYARPSSGRVAVGDLDIWFDGATQDLEVGDQFNILPRNGIYWHENTSSAMNISPVIRADGTDDPRRLTGGSLAAMSSFTSYYVGRYRDRLDALSETLVWEVNRIHSQGAGLTALGDVMGTYSVRDTTIALGSDASGLHYGDNLTAGNVMVYCFDAASGELASNSSYGPLDFDPTTAGIQNFDPAQHSLSDVAAAFNNTYGTFVTASIVNNSLRVQADSGYQFGFGTDSTGLLAALGVNTFFNGTDTTNLALNAEVRASSDRINAGHINGAGEFNPGDNNTALGISALAHTAVTVTTAFETTSSQTITEYYSTLVSGIGGDTSNAEFTFNYNKALADDLNDRQQAVSGVNLDEEMSNLIKHQHSYRAAAKLITTADQMLETILSLKS
ncbi:MAG: flagellar hook-associated protein FlgK [Desulfovibrio sp.]|nr:MAG: flagellar hook-associated protein FlgK [Desulfovibrio sp.]